MAKFDWWQGTVHTSDYQLVLDRLQRAVGSADILNSRPKNGYHFACEVVLGGDKKAISMWGGNPGVNTILSGENASKYSHVLQSLGAIPSRIDICEDITAPGEADRIFNQAKKFALDNGIKMNCQGDWVRGEARTLYLGSNKSVAQLRIYEKGYQMRDVFNVDADLNWLRIEAALRPKGQARETMSTMDPSQCLGASGWINRFLQSIGFPDMDSIKLGTVWKPSDTERSRLAMCKQYGKIMRGWADSVGGWDQLGPVIQQTLDSEPKNCWLPYSEEEIEVTK